MTDDIDIDLLIKRLDEISAAIQKPDILLEDATKLLEEGKSIADKVKGKIESIKRGIQ